jgi:hypothetical protein
VPNVAYGQIHTLSPLGSPGMAAEQAPQRETNQHKPWARQRQAAIINAALNATAMRWPLAKKPGFI